jgi:hypothetical protein
MKLILPGRVVAKKNSKKVIRSKFGRTIVLPSTQYVLWARQSEAHLAAIRAPDTALFNKSDLIHAEMHFFFKNHQNELDIDNCLGGPFDVLQKSGVIHNDKQIVSVFAEKHFGDANERAEITLTKIKTKKVSA